MHLFIYLQVIKNNLNPCWRKFSVPLQTFCGGDLNKPIKVIKIHSENLFQDELRSIRFWFVLGMWSKILNKMKRSKANIRLYDISVGLPFLFIFFALKCVSCPTAFLTPVLSPLWRVRIITCQYYNILIVFSASSLVWVFCRRIASYKAGFHWRLHFFRLFIIKAVVYIYHMLAIF